MHRTKIFAILGLLLVLPLSVTRVLAQPAGPVITTPEAVLAIYRLGSGDMIHVNVFDEADLSGDFSVSGDGKISLPLIGDTIAGGKTVSELQEAVAAAYSGKYLKDPKVNIQVIKFRPFYIYGEVGKPGEYPFSNGMTVLNAVALAEGFTYRANKKKVFIRRANENQETEVPITSDLLIEPGETLRIAERHF